MNRRHTIYISILVALYLTGCSGGIYANYRPIEELQTVETLGLDASRYGLRISCAVAQRGDSPGLTLVRDARSIAAGLDALRQGTEAGRLFFAHTRYLLLDADYAVPGIGSLLDFVERDVRTRMGTKLFLLREGSPEDALTGVGQDGITAALDALEQDALRRGVCPVYDVRRTAVALSEYGAAPVSALALTEGQDGAVLTPAGWGVLTPDGMAGWLEPARGEALGLLTGAEGTFLRQVPLKEGVLWAELSGADCRITYLPDAAALEITLELNAAVTELKGVSSLTDSAPIEAALAAAVESELASLLETLAAMDADAAGLGRALRLAGTEPGTLGPGWLGRTEYRLRAEITLDHSYDMGEPARAEGGGA